MLDPILQNALFDRDIVFPFSSVFSFFVNLTYSLLSLLPATVIQFLTSIFLFFVGQPRLACTISEQHLPVISVTIHLSNTFMQIW